MKFTVTFHGPFRVATGTARDGADDTIDLDNPLPASSLKGVIRAAASVTLAVPATLVDAVFGTAAHPSPWSWSDAQLSDDLVVRERARVSIDPATGTATQRALLFADEAWATTATFTIDRRLPIAPDAERQHVLVLRAAARAVTSLGADRRRGLGWVGITDPAPWSAADSKELLELRGAC